MFACVRVCICFVCINIKWIGNMKSNNINDFSYDDFCLVQHKVHKRTGAHARRFERWKRKRIELDITSFAKKNQRKREKRYVKPVFRAKDFVSLIFFAVVVVAAAANAFRWFIFVSFAFLTFATPSSDFCYTLKCCFCWIGCLYICGCVSLLLFIVF